MGKYIATLLAGMLLLAGIANAADTAPLRVGTAANVQPLIYQVDGNIVGMEADFVRLLTTQLRRPLQLQLLPAADLLPALARGDVDLVMSGLTITPEQEQLVDFTVPYLKVGQMGIIRTADVMRFRSSISLSQGGFRAGFVRASAGARYVGEAMDNAEAVPCASADECLQGLLDKRIDVFIADAPVSWRIATESRYGDLMSLYQPLTEEFLAWAVNKNNPQLRDQLNDALHSAKRLPLFEHILNRWVPVRIATD